VSERKIDFETCLNDELDSVLREYEVGPGHRKQIELVLHSNGDRFNTNLPHA
jgi:hypothetical protein